MQELKSKSAIVCNKILNHQGAFWQHKSYDHVVRDEKELTRIVNYVINNPVKAGICEEWQDWIGNYYNL